MLSCDNGHAIHPNHPEFADKNHAVTLGGGVVIKYNASQRYTSDAVTAGLFRLICDEADVPVQVYTNRADMPGGSTLGNISGTQVSVPTVDIGLAQLAMHASYETAGGRRHRLYGAGVDGVFPPFADHERRRMLCIAVTILR